MMFALWFLVEHLRIYNSVLLLRFECDGKLSFLNVNINQLQNGSSKYQFFRKPTHTNRYLDFASNHPLSHKKELLSAH